MTELQRLHPIIPAHFADESAYPAKAGVGISERLNKLAGIEWLSEKANILHREPSPH